MVEVKIISENTRTVKPVILVEYSKKYIDELSEKYPDISDAIEFIIDDKLCEQCEIMLGKKMVPVYNFEYLSSIKSDDYDYLIASDYEFEIYDKIHFQKNRSYTVYFFYDEETAIALAYRKKYELKPLENIIIFRSGPHANSYVKGMDFADNARALFEYMISKEYNKKYELVWFVKNPEDFNDLNGVSYGEIENVKFISLKDATSDDINKQEEYYRVLFLAKYIFMTDAYGFAKNCRKEQIRIQLWHGCGFKTRVNFASCEKRYEYNIVISDLYKKIHQKIYGLREDQVVVTGYPKQDWLRMPYEKSLQELFGIKKTKKVIFWLPTFRMADDKLKELNQYELSTETSLPIVGTYKQLDMLNEILAKEDIFIIIKFHPFLKKENIKHFRYSNIIGLSNGELVDKDLVINRLLADADALISDYSSAAVDYLTLDRPIAFTLDDVEEYKNSRGFVFDNIYDWLPGKEVFSFEDFVTFIHEIACDVDSTMEKRKKIAFKLNWFYDNNNCQRVLEQFGIWRD